MIHGREGTRVVTGVASGFVDSLIIVLTGFSNNRLTEFRRAFSEELWNL